MKKFLINGEFEDYFDSKILYRAKRYYVENRIWDVWCQDNLVTAYIDGSEIYKVELMIDEGRISHSYCSCPYSEDGEFMCKHMATLLYYLEENEVPELEKSKKKIENNKKDESELSKIYNGMQFELRKISDRYGFVNYYNGSYFVHLISEVSDYINGFIHDENYKDAFELIKYTYNFIKNTAMDGSNGEYQESFYIIDEVASKLLYDKEYYEKFLDYTYDVASSSALNDFSDAPLHAFILFVHDEESAKKVIEILGEIELRNGIFVNEVVEKITLTYDYIDEQEAIKMCYKNINYYGVKDLLISYLKKKIKLMK